MTQYKISYDFTIRIIVIMKCIQHKLSQRQYMMQVSLFALLLIDLAHYLQILFLLSLFLSYCLIVFINLVSILLQFYAIVIDYLVIILNLSFQLGIFLHIHIEFLILQSYILMIFDRFVLMFLSDGRQKLLNTIDSIFIIHNFRQIFFFGQCGLTGLQLYSLLITDILIYHTPFFQFLNLSIILLYLIHVSFLQFGEFVKVDIFLYFSRGFFSYGDEILLVDGAIATGFTYTRFKAYL